MKATLNRNYSLSLCANTVTFGRFEKVLLIVVFCTRGPRTYEFETTREVAAEEVSEHFASKWINADVNILITAAF